MVTRAVSRGTYTVDTSRPIARWNPYADLSYSFIVAGNDGRRAEVVLKEGVLPHRFFALWNVVLRGAASEAERRELEEVKRGLARQLVARPASDLFTIEATNAAAEPRTK